MGRDALSRIIYGSQIALIVSIGAVSLGIILGTPIGLISSYRGIYLIQVPPI
jgi:peptide/nickel transport system permease protein